MHVDPESRATHTYIFLKSSAPSFPAGDFVGLRGGEGDDAIHTWKWSAGGQSTPKNSIQFAQCLEYIAHVKSLKRITT